MIFYTHIYAGDEGGKFLRGEVATAMCGFRSEGSGTTAPERCPECRDKMMQARQTEMW